MVIILPTIELYRGFEVILKCSVTGTGFLSYSWFKNEKALTTAGSNIRIASMDVSESGSYKCSVFNGLIEEASRVQVVDIMCKELIMFRLLQSYAKLGI